MWRDRFICLLTEVRNGTGTMTQDGREPTLLETFMGRSDADRPASPSSFPCSETSTPRRPGGVVFLLLALGLRVEGDALFVEELDNLTALSLRIP